MLEIRGLRKAYGNTPVLRGVDLTVERGEVVVIMGPSGCGKSTLLRCVNRLIEPDAGDIRLYGESLLALSEEQLRAVRRNIGFVFQHFNLIQRLTAWQNVALGLVMAGADLKATRRLAEEALDRVGLRDLADRLPAQLSGGQQQRVGIARALLSQPELMLWDEPTAALDPIRVQEVLSTMESLVAEREAAMLIVTHEIPFAVRMADRLILMDRGEIVEEGKPAEVLGSPKSQIGKEYERLARMRELSVMESGRRTASYGEQTNKLQFGSGASAPA